MKTITIRKPLYDNTVYIRDIYLKEPKLKVKTPNGSWVIDTEHWKKTGKKMEKVFKKPDEPMILWGNDPGKAEQEEHLKLALM